jgi:hypothetical protein
VKSCKVRTGKTAGARRVGSSAGRHCLRTCSCVGSPRAWEPRSSATKTQRIPKLLAGDQSRKTAGVLRVRNRVADARTGLSYLATGFLSLSDVKHGPVSTMITQVNVMPTYDRTASIAKSAIEKVNCLSVGNISSDLKAGAASGLFR